MEELQTVIPVNWQIKYNDHFKEGLFVVRNGSFLNFSVLRIYILSKFKFAAENHFLKIDGRQLGDQIKKIQFREVLFYYQIKHTIINTICALTQQTQNMRITYVERRPNVVQNFTNVIQMFCVCWGNDTIRPK